MAIASDYRVTFPYGSTADPYGTAANPYHRGEDREMPVGTPVIINGVQIGLSGNSGWSFAPHLHVGRFVNGADTAPKGGGFSFSSATVTQISEDTKNGKYIRIQADGASWVYLHLSQQTCSIGQVLKQPTQGDEMITTSERAQWLYRMLRPNGGASQTELDLTINRRTFAEFVDNAKAEITQRDAALSRQAEAVQNAQNEAQNLRSTITQIEQVNELNAVNKDQRLAELGGQLNATTNDLQKALLEVERLNNIVCRTPDTTSQTPVTFSLLTKLLSIFVSKKKVT